MKETVTKYSFREAFREAGRADQFSYEALGLLFDYFEEFEEGTGQEMELDVIAICCEWSEFLNYWEAWKEIKGSMEEWPEEILEILEDKDGIADPSEDSREEAAKIAIKQMAEKGDFLLLETSAGCLISWG